MPAPQTGHAATRCRSRQTPPEDRGSVAPAEDATTEHDPDRHEAAIERGGGNVFAGIGLPDADVALVKSDIALRIVNPIEHRGRTAAEWARALGMDAAVIHRLERGDPIDVPLERLLSAPTQAGHDVEITIAPATEVPGAVAGRRAAD